MKRRGKKVEVDPQASKMKLENWLMPLIILTTFLGIALGVVESFIKFFALAEANLYLVMTVFYITTILLVLRSNLPKAVQHHLSNKAIRMILIVSASLLYITSMAWNYYEYNIRKTQPAVRPPIKLSQAANTFIGAVYAKAENNKLDLEAFYLNDDLCSFTETKQSLFAEGKEWYRTFIYNHEINDAFRKGQCIGPRGNKPIDDVLPILKRRLERTGQRSLMKYIETSGDLSRIIRDRGDIFSKIVFTSDELKEMKASAPAEYNTIKEWLLSCIGIAQPVITLVIRNSSNTSVSLTKVVYEVLAVGQVKGGFTGPLYPEITYDHTLYHRTGDQPHELKPPIEISPSASASFNLRLLSAVRDAGLAWLLKIKILDSKGESVTTEPVQIIMSK